jgi:hypothetical protein
MRHKVSAALRTRLSLAIGALAVVGACAFGEQYVQSVKESMENYPRPDALSCDTGKGLLLVDAVGSTPAGKFVLHGAAIANKEDPARAILSGSFKTGPLSPESSVVVFFNLDPGTYRLLKMRLGNAAMEQTIGLPVAKEFEAAVEAGRAHYLGQVALRQKFGSIERTIELAASAEKRNEAWTKVIRKFPDSSCLPLIRKAMESEP